MAQEQACFSVRKAVGLHNTDLLTAALDSLPGVESVHISKDESSIAVDFNSTRVSRKEIADKIEILGYPIEHA